VDVSNLPSLPVAVGASAAAIAALVSGLLALFAAPLANIPGLRPNDETRNAGMRTLLFLLNLLGLVGFAFTQNVVIARSEVPALLLTAALAASAGHIAYVSVKAVTAKRAADTTVSLTPADLAQVQSAQAVNTPPPASVSVTITPTSSASGSVSAL
jgi:hypothetical protein